jgi:hypothetical protein
MRAGASKEEEKGRKHGNGEDDRGGIRGREVGSEIL